MWVYIVYCILAVAASAVLLAGALVGHLRDEAHRLSESRYARRYMEMITARMLDGESVPMVRFPMCGCRGAREVLARLLAEAAVSTSPSDPAAVRRMVAANGVEGWLLRRVRLSHGCNRSRYMAMLSSLPVSRTTAECVRRYSDDGGCRMRFRTMLVAIAAEPSAAFKLIGDYPAKLTRLEMAELTSMLCRGMVPLAYAPMLASQNRNLQMLGLNIVRIFGAAEAECRLLEIVSESESEVCDEAIDVMAVLHLPLQYRSVVHRIRSMSACARRSLFRRLASEGYSVDALVRLAASGERRYAESLAASYKRTLVCHCPI